MAGLRPDTCRANVHVNYKVDQHGIIRTPNRFNGEYEYVPYFWFMYQEGEADAQESRDIVKFQVRDVDKREFPKLLRRRRAIRLQMTSDGKIREIRI